MKKPSLKSVISTIIVIAFLLVAIWYISSNYEQFSKIRISDPLLIIPAAIFILLNIYGAGRIIDLATEPHGIRLKPREAFGLAVMTRFSNQFSPSYVSATIRATYLKKVYGVSYTKFSSSFVVSSLLQFLISGILALATFLIINQHAVSGSPLVAIAVAIVFFIALLYMPINPLRKVSERLLGHGRKKAKFFERVDSLLSSYETVRKHPRLLPRSIAWMLVNVFALGIVYSTMYGSIGTPIDFASALFISSLTSWSILFSITPGSLGIREGLMVVAAQIAGVSLSATLVVAILLRLVSFILAGSLSAYFTPKLLHASTFKINTKKLL